MLPARAVLRLARPATPVRWTLDLDALCLRLPPASHVRPCIWMNTAGGTNTY
jgi:hypothetical protein